MYLNEPFITWVLHPDRLAHTVMDHPRFKVNLPPGRWSSWPTPAAGRTLRGRLCSPSTAAVLAPSLVAGPTVVPGHRLPCSYRDMMAGSAAEQANPVNRSL